MSQPPLYPEIGVVALVPDRWTPQWQPRHFVLSRLAAYFSVVWVNYPHGWRKTLSALRERGATDYPPCPPGLQIYRPEPWLPLVGRPQWLGEFTSRQRLLRACRLLRARGCRKIVVYIWRPEFARALKQLPWYLSVYHVDDEYSFSSTETAISAEELALLQSAGQVFIHSPALLEKKGRFNRNTEFVPNGVEYQAYATPLEEPDDLRRIPHPRIGYVGHLKQMLDWKLLQELSATHPQWSFVFVGPTSPHPAIALALEQMAGRPNVYFLGAKKTEELGAYPQHFDACIMPYKVDDYTRYIYPLKMHEYLASGRPVVSAPIRSVREFEHVIGIANTPGEWSSALERALSAKENTPQAFASRRDVARQHDWDTLVHRIARIIKERLHPDLASSRARDSHSVSLSAPLL